MFAEPIGSILWASTAVALLKDTVTIQEIFQYSLPETALHLEEFQASSQTPAAENRGSVIIVQIPVDMIALLLHAPGENRRTFQRHETIIRRFSHSDFSFAEENGSPLSPEQWKADVRNFHFQPDLEHETLTVKISFSLYLCGTRRRIVSLAEMLPACSPAAPSSIPLPSQQLEQEISACRHEIQLLQQKIRNLKKAGSCGPSQIKAAVGKKNIQYRQSRRFSPE